MMLIPIKYQLTLISGPLARLLARMAADRLAEPSGYSAVSATSDLGEHLLGHGNRVVDVRLGVRERHETRLVLRRRQVDAALEHAPVPLCKLGRVRLGGVGKALD